MKHFIRLSWRLVSVLFLFTLSIPFLYIFIFGLFTASIFLSKEKSENLLMKIQTKYEEHAL